MKNTTNQNWFDDLINDFVLNVPNCPQTPEEYWGQNRNAGTRMNKGHSDSVPSIPSLPTIKNHAEKIYHLTRWQTDTIKKWLIEIDEPEADHFMVLNKCRRDPEALTYFLEQATQHGREKRRQKVLKMLADNPEIKRAFVTDTEADPDNVILTMAIRDQYTFEMMIPREKYDAFLLLELIEKAKIQ